MKGLIGTMTVICMGIFLLGGCTQGILITKKDVQKDDQSVVEWQLGNQVEMTDWVALKKRVCEDLVYATATLPDQIKQDIYKYSCVENDRHALGKTLETLQPSQRDEIVKKLSEKEKDNTVNIDKILSRKGEILSIILSGVIWVVLCIVHTI